MKPASSRHVAEELTVTIGRQRQTICQRRRRPTTMTTRTTTIDYDDDDKGDDDRPSNFGPLSEQCLAIARLPFDFPYQRRLCATLDERVRQLVGATEAGKPSGGRLPSLVANFSPKCSRRPAKAGRTWCKTSPGSGCNIRENCGCLGRTRQHTTPGGAAVPYRSLPAGGVVQHPTREEVQGTTAPPGSCGA